MPKAHTGNRAVRSLHRRLRHGAEHGVSKLMAGRLERCVNGLRCGEKGWTAWLSSATRQRL